MNSPFPLGGAERFEAHRLLAHGGIGSVYFAFQRELQRSVAIKLRAVRTRALSDPAVRFVSEVLRRIWSRSAQSRSSICRVKWRRLRQASRMRSARFLDDPNPLGNAFRDQVPVSGTAMIPRRVFAGLSLCVNDLFPDH